MRAHWTKKKTKTKLYEFWEYRDDNQVTKAEKSLGKPRDSDV